MKYIKKYEGVFDRVDHIHDMLESNINGIFIDMIDDGFKLETRIDNYASNLSDIIVRNFRNTKPFRHYLDTIQHFHEYLTYNKYKFFHISVNGKWILDRPDGRAFQFTGNWESISNKLLDEWDKQPEDTNFKSIIISFNKK